jgi:hypothetical protein
VQVPRQNRKRPPKVNKKRASGAVQDIHDRGLQSKPHNEGQRVSRKLAESRQSVGRIELARNLILQAMVLESKSLDPELIKDAEVIRLQARILKGELLRDIKAEAVGEDLAAYDALVYGYNRFFQ